jgi:hypothetical protein
LLSCGGFAESIAVDSTGKIYTTVGSGVAVEAPPVNGHFRTVAFITGPHTGIVQPEGVAIGPGNVLYVTNSNFSGNVSVTEYRPGANGDAAPIRTIQGPKTLLDNTGSGSIAVDSSGKIYVANSSSITVYAANASGDASPIASIKGSRTLLSSGPGDIALDALNRIYVIILPNQGRNAFLLFSAGANGNVSPLRTTVTDAANGVPIAIALDSVGKVFVVQSGDFTADAIVTYARTTNGSYTERSVFYSQDSPPSLANAGGIAVR